MTNPVNGSRQSLTELIGLSGRTVVVTGAAQGIGAAIARRLAEAGANVMVADQDGAGAGRTAAEVVGSGGSARAVEVDVADASSVDRLAATAAAWRGTLYGWVNCAAIFSTRAVTELDDGIWRQTMAVHLDGSFHCARAATRTMTRQGTSGVIVLVTSLSAHRGRAGRSPYVAAKHGVSGLVKSLAVELGANGIRVVAVAPSVTRTAALEEASGDPPGRAVHDKMLADATAAIPLGRIGEPDEVARATLFAISDLASFVSGSTIYVDGGASAA